MRVAGICEVCSSLTESRGMKETSSFWMVRIPDEDFQWMLWRNKLDIIALRIGSHCGDATREWGAVYETKTRFEEDMPVNYVIKPGVFLANVIALKVGCNLASPL